MNAVRGIDWSVRGVALVLVSSFACGLGASACSDDQPAASPENSSGGASGGGGKSSGGSAGKGAGGSGGRASGGAGGTGFEVSGLAAAFVSVSGRIGIVGSSMRRNGTPGGGFEAAIVKRSLTR